MSNCILCFNHDKRNKFIGIKENLSESLTVADAISQHFPYIDVSFIEFSSKIFLKQIFSDFVKLGIQHDLLDMLQMSQELLRATKHS